MSAFLLTSAATACDQAIPINLKQPSPALAGIRDQLGQGYIERAFPALTQIDVLLMACSRQKHGSGDEIYARRTLAASQMDQRSPMDPQDRVGFLSLPDIARSPLFPRPRAFYFYHLLLTTVTWGVF